MDKEPMKRDITISKLKNRYATIRIAETVLFGVAAALVTIGVLTFFNVPSTPLIAVVTIAFAVVVLLRIRHLQIGSLNNHRMASWLNAKFPMLKESTHLLIKDESELNTLERLQLQRVEKAIQQVAPDVRLPHHLMIASGTLLIGIGLLLLSTSFRSPVTTSDDFGSDKPGKTDDPVANVEAAIKTMSIDITPPAYTGVAPSTGSTASIRVPEGSNVQWNVAFTTAPDTVRINFSNGQKLVLQDKGENYSVKQTISLPMLYQVEWVSRGKTYTSDYARIDVKLDQPPVVTMTDMPQFTRLMWGEKENIEVKSVIRDDYAISEAHVIATVSKGSGESVKFREEKLKFTTPAVVRGRNIEGHRILDFKKLGMEPGDEVYFYVEAFDNKSPVPQRSRTETFFVALLDTAANDVTVDSGLGIDLMPDYFRSQRQLIIDTEKLIAEQSKISKQQFNSTSNELGYDQKVLRLRYGQFMGEEFETAIGQPTNVQEAMEEEDNEDLMKQFGHQHDTENEHNLVADKKQPKETGHDHDHGEKDDDDDPMAAFRHDHDSEEIATFFNQSIKAKLRAALSLMWESELQLRLYQPKASLPHQYQILKLLKEIAQDSRIYVHRMGFDPPPLKEDRRLTADLDEIHSSKVSQQVVDAQQYPAITIALAGINKTLQNENVVITPALTDMLQAAGNELAAIAIDRPGNFLGALASIKSIVDGNAGNVRVELEAIQASFIQALPKSEMSATRQRSAAHPLDLKLMQELKNRTNE